MNYLDIEKLISIHAPHEGERLLCAKMEATQAVISIHAPHEGERLFNFLQPFWQENLFQSTLPTRGSDLYSTLPNVPASNFNPRSPRGGATRKVCAILTLLVYFNPRSPRGGATFIFKDVAYCCPYFNPRSPRGGATTGTYIAASRKCDFNPRSPRGGATPAFP